MRARSQARWLRCPKRNLLGMLRSRCIIAPSTGDGVTSNFPYSYFRTPYPEFYMRPALDFLILLIVTGLIGGLSHSTFASDFGSVGLIKIPTARMAADGELRATISREEVADIYNISYQATPWLEATFRYSIFNPRNYSYSSDDLRDRSYEAKVRSYVKGLDAGSGCWCSRYPRYRCVGRRVRGRIKGNWRVGC